MSKTTAQSAAIRFQLEGELFAIVEDWRRAQFKMPSRPEAIRQLIARALAHPDRSTIPPAQEEFSSVAGVA